MKRILVRASRLVAVSTAGSVLLGAGVVLLFTPGPGLLLLIAGMAVLATEFAWARHLRDRLVARANEARVRGVASRRQAARRRDQQVADSTRSADGATDRMRPDDVSAA